MPDPPRPVTNFGGNVRFTPRLVYAPATEPDVLAILDRHAGGTVRVVGALHSWSPAVVTADALIDLRRFDRVEVHRGPGGDVWATVGGGCRVKHLLRRLRHSARVTLPSVGLITEQTVAGAVSTATHGSGKHSLSHYVEELRVAAYDPATGRACVTTWNGGDELRAGRCALGCVGVILSVRFRCVPAYDVAETIVACATLDEVLAGEERFPLQQFYLIPHRWTYFAQRRRVPADDYRKRGWAVTLYRAYMLLGIDVGLHLVIRFLASAGRPGWTRFFFRRVLPNLIVTNATVVDRSDRMLVMKHELFRHLEIEIYVPAEEVRRAAAFVRAVLDVCDGAAPSGELVADLAAVGMNEELAGRRGTYTHHYPITFRRVLPDDALIAPSSGGEGAWYAISFITLAEPRDDFLALASFLGRSMARLFRARPHWGKYFPLDGSEVGRAYPGLPAFRAVCRRVDPGGVFRNEFVDRVLFGAKAHP